MAFHLLLKKDPTDFYSTPNRKWRIPYSVWRVGLYDHLLNIAPLFAPDWFVDAFIAMFGSLCYILTHSGIYFSTFLFM